MLKLIIFGKKDELVPVNYTNATEDSIALALTSHKYASAMVEDMGVVQANSDLQNFFIQFIFNFKFLHNLYSDEFDQS